MEALIFTILILVVVSVNTVSGSAKLYDGECPTSPVTIKCNEPINQNVPYGIKSLSDSAVFQDSLLVVLCNNTRENIFKASSNILAYKPFSGVLKCEQNEAITGFEVCYEEDNLEYVALICRPLEDDYVLSYVTKVLLPVTMHMKKDKDPYYYKFKEVICGEDMVMIAMKLDEDSSGNIGLTMNCGFIAKRQ